MVVEQKEGHKSLVGLMAKDAGKRSGPAGQQVDGGGRRLKERVGKADEGGRKKPGLGWPARRRTTRWVEAEEVKGKAWVKAKIR